MRFKLLISLILVLTTCSAAVYGQRVHVSCRTVDHERGAIPFTAIQVSNATDSVNDHYDAMADSNGLATFSLRTGGTYIIHAFSAGYKKAAKNIIIKNDKAVFNVMMETDTKSLKDVEITYKKPILRQEDDKTVVDPEELASSSTNAYDIMEKVPGLYVDQDGNIYITSSTPATIYINGREQKMSNSDVAAMLKSLPPNSIEKIEIMRTPSTKYDASTSGGIVNVVLKKGVHIGLTGSIGAGVNQGTYGNQYIGATINNNNDRLSTNFTVQVSQRASGERLKTDRVFAPDSMLSQNAYTKYPGSSLYGSYSITYTPKSKWELTYDGRISMNKNGSMSNSPSTVERISSGIPSVHYTTSVDNNSRNVNLNQGFATKYKIDTSGSEWTNDLSVNYMPVNATQNYNTDYTLPASALMSGDGATKTGLLFFSAQTDLDKKLKYKLKLETGLKATGVNFNSDAKYTINYNGLSGNDPSRTNAYSYDERIYAAYLQMSKQLASVLVKGGARLENTNMDGKQTVPSDTGFTLHRTDLFPYLYVSRKVMSISGYELRAYLIYRRTITRPAYDYLNPFPKYVDQYLSEVGNPSLKPQFTKNYEANVSVDDRPLLAVGYNDMTDIFSQVIYEANNNSRQTYRTYDNLGSNKELYVKGLGAIPPGGVYFFVLGGQYTHNIYQGYYDGQPLAYKHGSWTFFTYQTLKLGKLTQLVLNGFMRLGGQVQFYELSNFGSLNLSVNHQFLQKKLKITASVTDMFLTNNNQFTIDQANIHATGLRKGDTRRFGLNANYNFGVKKREDHNFLNAESPEDGDK